MKLSDHFQLEEFTKSQTAERRGIDNAPPPAAVDCLIKLCRFVLEPVRHNFGIVNISSGYRSAELNEAVGSKPSSQHRTGQAADFECPGIANPVLSQWILDQLDFDQLILEFYTPGQPNSGWVHCSYVSSSENRRQALTINRTGTKAGLHP